MKVDKEKCIGCKACHPYCPVSAIFALEHDSSIESEINQDDCVECGACLRSEICAQDAIFMPDLEWPRVVRAQFGNPYFHPKIREGVPLPPEIKTNDITARITDEVTEIVIEMGRPGISTSFLDVQKVCTALVLAGVALHPGSALATVMEDLASARIKADVLGERALNVMIHGRIQNNGLHAALEAVKRVSGEIETCFSLSLVSRLAADSETAALSSAQAAGFNVRPHAKINIGLGRRFERVI